MHVEAAQQPCIHIVRFAAGTPQMSAPTCWLHGLARCRSGGVAPVRIQRRHSVDEATTQQFLRATPRLLFITTCALASRFAPMRSGQLRGGRTQVDNVDHFDC